MPYGTDRRDRYLAASRALMTAEDRIHCMSVQVRLPSALRSYADGASIVEVPASDVGGALAALVAQHERLRAHLFDESGQLRGFVGLYLNQKDVKTLQRQATPTRAGDVLMVLPSVAGGAA